MKTYRLPGFKLELSNVCSVFQSSSQLSTKSLFESAEAGLKAKFSNKTVGFFDWPQTISSQELKEIDQLSQEIKSKFQGLLVCGIGGSHLGAAAVLEALRSETEERNFPIFWLNNVDRWSIDRAKSFVSERKVATLIISKSGNTIETLSGFFHLHPYLDPKGIVIITDPETGELRRWIHEQGYPHLPVPENIGGRFSVLTSVGLLPMAIGGLEIHQLLNGAKALREMVSSLPTDENPAYQIAAMSFFWDTVMGHHTQYLMPYQSNLKLLTDWYVQLWAESLGKKDSNGKSVGPTFVGALGTRDQHSLLQLFKEGPNNKLIGFIDVLPGTSPLLVGRSPVHSPGFDYLSKHTFEEINSKAQLATAKSLETAGVPTYRFVFDKLSAETLGSFLLFQELSCAIAGEFYQVNAFNQPGVEEAKKLLRQSL